MGGKKKKKNNSGGVLRSDGLNLTPYCLKVYYDPQMLFKYYPVIWSCVNKRLSSLVGGLLHVFPFDTDLANPLHFLLRTFSRIVCQAQRMCFALRHPREDRQRGASAITFAAAESDYLPLQDL